MIKYSDKLYPDNRITILALSWRDIKSPTAGGAEVQTHEMLSHIDHEKYRVIHFAAMYPGLSSEEIIDEVNYIRRGNVFTVIFYAFLFYSRNRGKIDFVLEQCNTHRFFTPLWIKKDKRIFYIHQLTREIWDINTKPPISTIGKITETPLLRLNMHDYTIALSNSTKQDLIEVGFNEKKIKIIPIAMKIQPWSQEDFLPKEEHPTFVYVGRYVNYKGIDAAVEAVGILKKEYSDVKLWLLGKKNNEYIEKKLIPICNKYNLSISDEDDNSDIVCWGYVDEKKKLELLSRATALVFPSNREGWGIPISEAAYVGTPSIVYNSPGLKDAVNMGEAGYLCDVNSETELAINMKKVVENREEYNQKISQAYRFSSSYLDIDIGKEFMDFVETAFNRGGIV